MFHIIDDEEMLRTLVKTLINKAGHDVLCFESGSQYLEYLNAPDFQQPFAVLTDVTMPGINGYDLTLEIRKLLPHQKIILITGFADDEHNQFAADQLCYTLNKPYRSNKLLSLLTALAACEEAHKNTVNPLGHFQQCEFGIDHNCPFYQRNK